MKKTIILAFLAMLCCFSIAQEPVPPEKKAGEDAPISGGTVYAPVRGDDDKLRDPFTSPFEITEEDNASADEGIPDPDDRLPYSLGELELRGIYLQADLGYLAIFKLEETVYKWFPEGTRFKDADLVNITDGSVKFKHYVSGDDQQVREVVKVLRRGEE